MFAMTLSKSVRTWIPSKCGCLADISSRINALNIEFWRGVVLIFH